jgi:inner membrane protein
VAASYYRKRAFAIAGIAWLAFYLSLAVVQRERAEMAGMALALERGHQPQELAAKPSFANILVWKLVYQTDEAFYVDAVRAGVEPRLYPGQKVSKLDPTRDLPWLDKNSQQAKDLERFRWFSNGYIAQSPNDPLKIIDIRYSIVPNEIAALWSVTLKPNAANHEHVSYQNHRDNSRASRQRFWQMLGG